LSDGNFAVFYEDEAAHLKYTVFRASADGVVSEINGENLDFKPDLSSKAKRSNSFKRFTATIKFALGLM
jgi:hypothetical protein